MNTPAKIQHPTWMTDDDIALYDQMVSLGESQIGKEIGRNEEYLLHLASMITLKQMKGMIVDLDDPSITELKRIHQEFQEQGLIFQTPKDEWYASAEELKKPYLPPDVEKEINDMNNATSNLVIEDKKTSNIADEPTDDEIKKEWVKLVEPPS